MARAPAKKKRATERGLSPRRVLCALASLLLALDLLAALAPSLWLSAMVGELGFHLALLAALAAVWAGVLRAWLSLLGLIASAMLLAAPLWPLYRASKPTPEAGPLVRVAALHLAGAALELGRLEAMLVRTQPDALALTDVPRDSALGDRLGTYRVLRARHDAGTALLVQSALITPQRALSRDDWPSATVRVGRCHARIVAVALPKLANYARRDARAVRIHAAATSEIAPRSVWLGQLGSRAEASDLAAFVYRHGLRDGRLGHGRLASAPGALGALGFPLAHVLVHGWISVREVMTHPAVFAGAQRTVAAVLELTEPRCRFDPTTRSE